MSNKLFKRKRYGYGWTPVSPLGWLILLVYVAAVIFGGMWFLADVPDNTLNAKVIWYLVFVAVSTAVILWISYKFGPKPKWRWGKKPDDNPDEDF